MSESLYPSEGQTQEGRPASGTGAGAAPWVEASTRGPGLAAQSPQVEAFAPGQVLGGRYQIRSCLGRGGMGEVWLALDLRLHVEVALKSLHPHLDEGERGRFSLRHEVRAAREVLSPNVCRIYDLVEADGHELLSMEYVDGQSLQKLLETRGPLDLTEAGEIAGQLLAGLSAIHRAGLVHRDLKPANVMLTRTGRVVVMDLGLARRTEDGSAASVSGTPAYMSPEQSLGRPLDARSDLYSAALTLAEMIGLPAQQAPTLRRSFLAALRQDPPQVPDGPWRQVLARALQDAPAARYESAQALARALEEVTLHADRAEGRSPYPGLAAFTEQDTQLFFGREAEVELMVKKLQRHDLLGLIGPSGAGKSSFLRAGLLPAKPEGWGAVVCKPGREPFAALAQALVPELAGDSEAVKELLRFEEPQFALAVLGRWRRRHREALLAVDPFEELFTNCAPQVQQSFIDLLGRTAAEAGVRVLLLMRDDFLFHCTAYPHLAPIFSDLTPLGPPAGEALRRALVQPALRCGYRFEDEGLVEEMLAEVRQERGALPLLAFAASRLWEERDRQAGLLTRTAYARIQGVAGALAQHAEATLQRIGPEREPLVRELFRNLVTAQGTRANRSTEELLSVAGAQRSAAEEVLRGLVDARLLISYEGPESDARRVEIIHESLLRAWPRMARWQAQDADGAVLRDQLRNAAEVWAAQGRPAELLWSGGPFRELQLWRERYRGGLSGTEEAFVRAMSERVVRRSRRLRLAVSGVILLLSLFLGAMTVLYRNSEQARNRAEAARLLGLGRLALQDNPSASLAYALAGLELYDDPVARRFAIEALSKGPSALAMDADMQAAWGPAFSPDGRWLAVAMHDGTLWLLSRDGGAPRVLRGHEERPRTVAFGTDGRLLFSVGRDKTLRTWSVPEGQLLRTVRLPGPSWFVVDPDGQSVLTASSVEQGLLVQRWPAAGGEPVVLGQPLPGQAGLFGMAVDRAGRWLALGTQHELGLLSLEAGQAGRWTALGTEESEIWSLDFDPSGQRLAVGSKNGEVRLWSVSAATGTPERVLRGHQGAVMSSKFSPDGSMLATCSLDGTVRLWDMGPLAGADPEPVVLRLGKLEQMDLAAFDPSGRWLATTAMGHPLLHFWPLDRRYATVLRGHQDATVGLAFDPQGAWLASASEDGKLRRWPLQGSDAAGPAVLFQAENDILYGLAFDPLRRLFIVGTDSGKVWLLPEAGGAPKALEGFSSWVDAVALSPDGRLAAAGAGRGQAGDGVVRLWDVDSGAARLLDPGVRNVIHDLAFSPDGARLAAAENDGLRLWDLGAGSSSLLWPRLARSVRFSPDGRQLLAAGDGVVLCSPEDGTARTLPAHAGKELTADFLPEADLVVSGDGDGVVRAGPMDGQSAHFLLGHSEAVRRVSISPDGRWIASSSDDNTVRLWPVPQGRPFHLLPHEAFVERLRSLTTFRAVRDEQAPSGYRLELAPFPGWNSVPVW